MGPSPQSIINTGVHSAVNTSEMHNASMSEAAAQAGGCAQVHLSTGQMCTLPHGHRGSCEFISAQAAARWLAMRPMTASGTRARDVTHPRAERWPRWSTAHLAGPRGWPRAH
jgi:hypothetical protein